MRIGMRHQFGGFFCRGIKRERMVCSFVLDKRHHLIGTIDRTRRGHHQVTDLVTNGSKKEAPKVERGYDLVLSDVKLGDGPSGMDVLAAFQARTDAALAALEARLAALEAQMADFRGVRL